MGILSKTFCYAAHETVTQSVEHKVNSRHHHMPRLQRACLELANPIKAIEISDLTKQKNRIIYDTVLHD